MPAVEPQRNLEPRIDHLVELGGSRLMMYGNGFGWGWMWFGGVTLLLILAALIILIIRTRTAVLPPRGGQLTSAPNTPRQIAEERLARGEITPDEYRQVVRGA
jgi:putative membrane protein